MIRRGALYIYGRVNDTLFAVHRGVSNYRAFRTLRRRIVSPTD